MNCERQLDRSWQTASETYRKLSMKFYDCQTAPSPRRVRMFIAEKRLEIPTQEIDLRSGEQLGEAFESESQRHGTGTRDRRRHPIHLHSGLSRVSRIRVSGTGTVGSQLYRTRSCRWTG